MGLVGQNEIVYMDEVRGIEPLKTCTKNKWGCQFSYTSTVVVGVVGLAPTYNSFMRIMGMFLAPRIIHHTP